MTDPLKALAIILPLVLSAYTPALSFALRYYRFKLFIKLCNVVNCSLISWYC